MSTIGPLYLSNSDSAYGVDRVLVDADKKTIICCVNTQIAKPRHIRQLLGQVLSGVDSDTVPTRDSHYNDEVDEYSTLTQQGIRDGCKIYLQWDEYGHTYKWK